MQLIVAVDSFELATPVQARALADRLERDFVLPGGFATTSIVSGRPWDAPNGRPPPQWMTAQALCGYDRERAAATAR